MEKEDKKIKGWFLTILAALLFCCACTNQNTKDNKWDLSKYDTPYTKCEKNQDGTYSFYIYSAPVRYEQDGIYYEKDPSLVASDKKEYLFMNKQSNIRTYYPAYPADGFLIKDGKKEIQFCLVENADGFSKGEVVSFENMYGDTVEAVHYRNHEGMQMYCYTTISGIQIEYLCPGDSLLPALDITADAFSQERHNNGYVVLKNKSEKEVVVYEPVMREAGGGSLGWNAKMSCRQSGKGCTITMKLPENAGKEDIRLAFSIERYVDKLPDSSVYSKLDSNSYLRNYAVVGEQDDFGTGIHYLRFRFNYYLSTDRDNIISAGYYTRLLDAGSGYGRLQMFPCNGQWSSTQMLWENRVECMQVPCADGSVEAGDWLCFDITDFTRACFSDTTWLMESLGCTLQCSDGYVITATSDNSLYVPYVRLVMKELPKDFSGEMNINPEE